MLEFHSSPVVSRRTEDKCRSIFALAETMLWSALPENAVRCVFVGKIHADSHEYEARFYDSSGEVYINGLQDPVSERVMSFVAELRELLLNDDQAGGECRCRASLSKDGIVRTEFLCFPDMVEIDLEIFMYRIWRDQPPPRRKSMAS